MSDESSIIVPRRRFDDLLVAIARLAAGEPGVRLPISVAGDEIDALSLGVNMLAAELAYTTVSKDYMERVVDAIPELLIVTSEDGTIVSVNQGVVEALARPRAAIQGLNVAAILGDSWEPLKTSLDLDGTFRDRLVSVRLADGRERIFGLSGSVAVEPRAATNLWVLVARDMTETHRAEQLERAKNAAEEASRLKSDFLANVSHEIRTPITAILGFAELLARSKAVGPEASYHERILRNGRHLLQLIDGILDLAAVESGKLAVRSDLFSPLELVRDVVSTLEALAAQRSLDLRILVTGAVPGRITSDAGHARQILLNVIGNAVKYTPAGQVTVTVTGAAAGGLVVDVEDTGVGIGLEAQTRLFQAFSRVGAEGHAHPRGSGLGLALARRLATALGGDVELVRSVPAEGSWFRVHLANGVPGPPAGTCAAPPPAGKASLAGLRILLVEDEPDNQELFGLILRDAGACVEVVGDGLDAVQCVPGGRFDVVLMDLRLPIVGGIEALGRLRGLGYLGRIVAFTAHAMPGEIERCLKAGFDAVVTKPVSRETLVRCVRA